MGFGCCKEEINMLANVSLTGLNISFAWQHHELNSVSLDSMAQLLKYWYVVSIVNLKCHVWYKSEWPWQVCEQSRRFKPNDSHFYIILAEHQQQPRTQNMIEWAQYSCSLSLALTRLWTNLDVVRLKENKTPLHVSPFHLSFLRLSHLCNFHSSYMCSSLTWVSGYVLSLLYSSTVCFSMLLSFVCISGCALCTGFVCIRLKFSCLSIWPLCISLCLLFPRSWSSKNTSFVKLPAYSFYWDSVSEVSVQLCGYFWGCILRMFINNTKKQLSILFREFWLAPTVFLCWCCPSLFDVDSHDSGDCSSGHIKELCSFCYRCTWQSCSNYLASFELS